MTWAHMLGQVWRLSYRLASSCWSTWIGCVSVCWDTSGYASTCAQNTTCLCDDTNFQNVSIIKKSVKFSVSAANNLEGRSAMPAFTMPDDTARLSNSSCPRGLSRLWGREPRDFTTICPQTAPPQAARWLSRTLRPCQSFGRSRFRQPLPYQLTPNTQCQRQPPSCEDPYVNNHLRPPVLGA